MKWLILLFSIVKPFLNPGSEKSSFNPIAELREMIRENAAQVVILFAGASALATLFAAGIVIIAVDIGAQYDQNAYVYLSTMIIMGLVLVLLPLIIGAVGYQVFTKEDTKKKVKVKARDELLTVGTSHPLQDALALLIHDFVKEREYNRSEEALAAKQAAATRPTHAPTRHPEERIPAEGLHRH